MQCAIIVVALCLGVTHASPVPPTEASCGCQNGFCSITFPMPSEIHDCTNDQVFRMMQEHDIQLARLTHQLTTLEQKVFTQAVQLATLNNALAVHAPHDQEYHETHPDIVEPHPEEMPHPEEEILPQEEPHHEGGEDLQHEVEVSIELPPKQGTTEATPGAETTAEVIEEESNENNTEVIEVTKPHNTTNSSESSSEEDSHIEEDIPKSANETSTEHSSEEETEGQEVREEAEEEVKEEAEEEVKGEEEVNPEEAEVDDFVTTAPVEDKEVPVQSEKDPAVDESNLISSPDTAADASLPLEDAEV